MDFDIDMTTFARPTVSLDTPPPLESRFPKEHMPVVQRVQESNSNKSGPSHRLSPLSHEIRLAKIPRTTGIAVSSLARMKIKHRRAFARQVRTDLIHFHLSNSCNNNNNNNNSNNNNNVKALQDQIEDLRDMFENLWVSLPRIHGWKASKTFKCGSKYLRGATNARPNHQHSRLTHRARHNHRSARSSPTRRELLISFVRATSRRFRGCVMPKK